MQKILDYIFIDLDGPILDNRSRHFNCYKDIILKYGGDVLPEQEYWDMKRSKIKNNILLSKSSFNATYKTFLTEWIENIEKREYLKFDQLKPDILQTVQQWSGIARNIYLVTMRHNHKNLVWQLKTLKIYNIFDKVISCSFTNKNSKYKTLENLKFESAIFIGDTEEDTHTAKLLHIKCIGILNGSRKKELLNADWYSDEIKNIDLKNIAF